MPEQINQPYPPRRTYTGDDGPNQWDLLRDEPDDLDDDEPEASWLDEQPAEKVIELAPFDGTRGPVQAVVDALRAADRRKAETLALIEEQVLDALKA